MKIVRSLGISLLLLSIPYTSSAAEEDASSDLNALVTNLGAFLGYDLTTQIDWSPVGTLLDITGATLMEQSTLVTLFGAIPVNAYSDAFSAFVPSSSAYSNITNQMANYTFASQSSAGSYNSSSGSTAGGVSVTAGLDQNTYQNDPISQNILNTLGTPNYTYCMNNDTTAWLTDCSYLYDMNIASNALGTLPQPSQFFTYAYNQTIIPQLNGNTLIAPLLYTATAQQQSGSSSQSTTSPGLTATNQIQEAANFIRYATYGTNPVALPSFKDYSNAYATATMTTTDSTTSLNDIIKAQSNIISYFSNLRSYAAQMSVPVSNLYAILSKRMPQQNGTNTATLTSQALSEFQMATRRLYDPAQPKDNQWINQINSASAATVQKEIAILLSEINYQLYLNRQQQERELLTASITLIQSLHQSAPDFSSSASDSAAADATTTSTTDTTTTSATAPTSDE